MAKPLALSAPIADAAAECTIAFYDREAERYFEATLSNDLSPLYAEFLGLLPVGGRVLDAGCGSGRDTLAFLERGFWVDAFDASTRLAALATGLTGVDVQVRRFEDWSMPPATYDGIWAFASLLHVARGDLPHVLSSLARTLKPSGWLFASFKRGEADRVDEVGRHYTDLTVAAARQLFSDSAGFASVSVWQEAGPAGLGGTAEWVYVLASPMPEDPLRTEGLSGDRLGSGAAAPD